MNNMSAYEALLRRLEATIARNENNLINLKLQKEATLQLIENEKKNKK